MWEGLIDQFIKLCVHTIQRAALDSMAGPASPSWRLGLARDYKKAAMTENTIAKEIMDAAYLIHATLGPGLLESVYHAVLA